MKTESFIELPVTEQEVVVAAPFVKRFCAIFCYIGSDGGMCWLLSSLYSSADEAQKSTERERHVPHTIRVFEIPEVPNEAVGH